MILDMLYQSFYCANFSEEGRVVAIAGGGERDKGLFVLLPPFSCSSGSGQICCYDDGRMERRGARELHSVLRNPLPSPQNETSSAAVAVARDEVEGCSRQISLFILLSSFFAPD